MTNAHYLSGRIGSLPIAALLTYMDDGKADDCRKQSQPPSMAVGRIGSLPIATLPPSMAVVTY
jgi:hypothetical protein